MKKSKLKEFIKTEIINELSTENPEIGEVNEADGDSQDTEKMKKDLEDIKKTSDEIAKTELFEDDIEEPTNADVKKEKGAESQKREALRKQERSLLVADFLKQMTAKGIVDGNKKILDKESYSSEWVKAKKEIEAKVKKIK